MLNYIVLNTGTSAFSVKAVNVPLLDTIGDASAAYGLRLLRTGYSGQAIAVRRSTDDATTTIGFTAAGHLDINTLTTFANGGDVYVTTWFDQSGGTGDLTQSTASLQPLIVSAGAVIAGPDGRPRLQFNSDVLVSTNTEISNQDLTAFFVQQSEYSITNKTLLGLGSPIYYNLQFDMKDKTGAVSYIGDGSSASGVGDTSHTTQPAWQTIQVLDLQGQTIKYFRNTLLIDTETHAKNVSVTTRVQIGSYIGYISEIVLYQHLSDADRLIAYNNINDYFNIGPRNANAGALLPQDLSLIHI